MNAIKTRRVHIWVAGIVGLVSIILIAVAGFSNYRYVFQLELEAADRTIGQLVETVNNTASIAAYLKNEELANDVIDGLNKNDIVDGVVIISEETVLATSLQSEDISTEHQYPLISPFDGEEVVGYISIKTNNQLIQQRAQSVAINQGSIISIQILIIVFLVMLLINKLLAKPLEDLLRMCVQIGNSNYDIKTTNQQFTEFKTIEDALAKMAQQVESQIEELIAAKDVAEHSERAKASFLANTSHEIRTPLNAIIGYIQVLESQTTDTEQLAGIQTMKDSSMQLLHVLNDILDISKLDAGGIAINPSSFSIKDMLLSIQALFKPDFDKKGLRFDIVLDNGLADYYLGDELRIRQIIANLTSNSYKFTETGGVTLSARHDGTNLIIKVSDTGKGIKEEYLNQLFQPFTQEDGNIARKYGGTGLGLNISQKLIDMMDGHIIVDSKVGLGSLFKVVLPLAATEKPEQIDTTVDVPEPAELIGKILIAEDNIVNQKVFQGLLKPTNLDITFAVNGVDAINLAQQQSFDLILMDVQMPQLDGISATRKLREDESYEKPIIGVSAAALTEEVAEAKQAGMDDYLAKPVLKNELYSMLAKWLPSQ